jgi:hypothetical protein
MLCGAVFIVTRLTVLREGARPRAAIHCHRSNHPPFAHITLYSVQIMYMAT